MYGLCGLFSSHSICSIRYYSSNSTKKLLEFLATMPKANSARIAEAQRQRQHLSKKSEKYGPSSVYLQVLGSGARGGPNTLYLFTDQKRYLFNCGECTQRLAHEHKVRLSKLDHIFITSKTWKNIGGLPGLSLTLQDVGVPNITLHGPEGLDELYQATRRFVIMKDMNVTMEKCSPAEDFSDNVMTVKYVIMGPLDNILTDKDLVPVSKKPKLDPNADKEFEEFIHDETDYYKPEIRNMEAKNNKNVKDKEKAKVKPIDPSKKKTEKVLQELQKKTNPSVAYICTLKKRLGTLDLAKCVERGVKPGPMLGLLKTGQDVVLPDGTLVLSKDVKTPDDPGPVFIVLDVPDISYLKESEFSAHFDNPANPPENVPTLIVHFTAPHVFHHPQYRAFIAMFGSRTQHLVLNNQNACLGSEAVHRTQHKLHLLDPDVFPLLRDVSVPAVWNAHPPVPKTNSPVRLKGLEELKNKIALAQFQNIISLEGSCKGDGLPPDEGEAKLEVLPAHTLTMFHLRPKREIDRSAEPKLHIQEYIQETMDMDGFAGSLDQFRRLVDSIRYAKSDSQKEYPKIVFLGTGSCIPSKTRNTSAIVVHIDENRSILMDCGEGTFGQLVRFYGPRKVNAFLRTLKAIYISHLHADHHIGLIGVLQGRREAFEETGQARPPLYLLAPGQIVTWLTLYDQQFEKIRSEFTLIPNQNLLQESSNQWEVMTSATLASIGVQHIRTCLVAHCPNAFGVAIDLDGLNKITYSGDTLPCEELVKIGENSTLLIHEATMEDELADEARTKMHSTTSQAIEIGRQMNARFTVLTHFSQRYARLPRLNAHILNDNNSVGIAFDNMQITMSDLELLPHMYAPLQLMFAEHCVEMELKAAQRARLKERRASSPAAEPAVDSGEDRKRGRSRWISPGCRTTNSSPTPQANYVESNSSRLRQELKGMTITGIVRNPRSRSSSASPPKSPCRADSRGTMSETANLNRETLEKAELTRSRMTNTPSSAFIIDTRSKTMNRVQPYRPPTGDEVLNVMAQKIDKVKTEDFYNFNSSPCDRNGYGRPLVTQLNKKLMIRKDVPSAPISSTNNGDKAHQLRMRTRSQSRGSRKAENREPAPAPVVTSHVLNKQKILAYAKVDVGTSVLVYVIYWRLTHITASLLCLRWSYLHSIIAVGVLFWTATKATVSGNTSRANDLKDIHPALKSNVNSRQARPLSATDKNPMSRSPTPTKTSPKNATSIDKKPREVKPSHHEYQREMKVMNLESNYSPLSPTSRVKPSVARKTPSPDPARRYPIVKSIQGNMNDKSKYSITKECSTSSKQSQESAQQSLTRVTNSKHALAKEANVKTPFKANSAVHSAKSFKPQLEDIKSSYLLLNSTKKNGYQMASDNDGKALQGSKAKLFDDEMRRQQLMEVKRKFQSRRFITDSRYEKIEGLNWISWK